jgi:hypothetical protein
VWYFREKIKGRKDKTVRQRKRNSRHRNGISVEKRKRDRWGEKEKGYRKKELSVWQREREIGGDRERERI